jgi:hypothetical protein
MPHPSAGSETTQEGSKFFFSEEKKQKTFTFPLVARSRPWPGSFRRRQNKSLLLLFFRKEGLASQECV